MGEKKIERVSGQSRELGAGVNHSLLEAQEGITFERTSVSFLLPEFRQVAQ